MDLVGIGREALRTTWRHRALWVFGLFVAGSGVGGGARPEQAAANPLGLGWIVALGGVALVLGLAALWMHVVSEGALIDGAARARRGEPVRAGEELRAGQARFGPVLRVKLAAVGVLLLGIAVLSAPAIAALAGALPVAPAVAIGLAIAAAVVPWLVTAFLVYPWALRLAVLDQLGAADAIRGGWRFLHGRVLESLKLVLLAFLGQLAGGFLAAVVSLPGVLVGLAVWLATGAVVPAAVVGGVLALPFVLVAVAIAGTFRSTIWTLGFLDSRAAATP